MSGSQFFCTGCGYRLLPGKRFCINCGKQIGAALLTPKTTSGGSLLPGAIMGGRWQISRQLGKGGMGAVYLVHDTRLNNRRAALKEMLDCSRTLHAHKEAVERFNREAETLAALNHANIPHIYDRFAEADRVYMVMEFIDGMDLERLLRTFQKAHGTPLPEAVIVRHAYQLCSVLEYLHRQTPPTLHRDLKPSNIIFETGGLIKLIDFGIAKVFNPGSQGTGLGTQGFAAPEQYKGLAEPRTDLYALGATLHHLLTGRDPQMETPFDFPRISQLIRVSPGLEEMVMALLEMRPENRPANAAQLRRRLLELYPGVQEWDEDPRILQLTGAKPASTPTPPAPQLATAPLPANTSALRQPMQSLQLGSLRLTQPSPAIPPEFQFCIKCGNTLAAGIKFCTHCGHSLTASPQLAASPPRNSIVPQPDARDLHAPIASIELPAASSGLPVGLTVPEHLSGSEPLELLMFEDDGEPYALLGIVQLNGTEYAFISPGRCITAGSPVEVYTQKWHGPEAFFEPAQTASPDAVAQIQMAWQSLYEQL